MVRFCRIVSLILTLVLVFVLSQLTVFAGEPDRSGLFAGGSGTIDDPYLISDDDQFQNINEDLAAYYELTNDIEILSGSFTPIGTSTRPFSGVLDGKNYHIKNFNFDAVNGPSCIFETNSGTIKRLQVSDSNVIGYTRANAIGLICLYNNGAITNCSVSDLSYNQSGLYSLGGIAYRNYGTISKCCTVGLNYGDYSGGISAYNYGQIEKCAIFPKIAVNFHCGCLAGQNEGQISDCCVFNPYGNGLVFENKGGSISRCYYVDTNTDTSRKAQIVQLNTNGGSINKVFFFAKTYASGAILPGVKLCTPQEMTNQSLYSGFDFDGVWEFRNNCAYPLPVGVNIPDEGSGISLSNSVVDMSVLNTFQLSAELAEGSLSELIIWSSSDKSVATVDDSGLITKTGYGSCEITATSVWGNKTASCNVAVVKSIEDCTISGIADKTYTGEEITQNIVVKNGTETVDSKYYTVTYKNNINVGTATVTIKGRNGFTDYVDKTFTINQRELSADDFEIPSKEYTGENQSPEIVTSLSADDYDVSTVSESAAGSYDVTISGKGNCTGTVTVPFVITAKKLTSDMFTVSNATYNGTAQTPNITSDLIKGTDYTVAVDSAVNAGDYDVTITGKGNYSGTVTKTFTIQPAALSADMFEVSDATYTGSAIESEITTALNDDEYTVKYSKNTNVGTATATITGKGNYTGSVNKTFSITPLTIKASMFTIPAVTYTGSALEPAVTTDLHDDNYSVEYSNNINAGTGTATITGIGNCTGSATVYFTIDKKAITADMFEVESAVYDGTKLKPAVTTDLTEEDYSVTYSNNINVGNGVATIKGKGNYTDSVDIEFTITPAKVTADMFTVSSVTYTGEALIPEIETDLTENDFTVTFKNNVNAGTATATFKGTGNYSGTVNKTFKVDPATLKSSMFTVSDAEYTGRAIIPKITSSLSEDDYDVEFEDNTSAGTGKAIFTGKGNYTGSVTKTFTISARAITEDQFVVKTAIYTGSPINPTIVTTLNENVDYIVSSDAETNAGTYEVTILGKGNYFGSVIKKFTINPAAITPVVTLASESYTYDGQAKTPAVTVKNGDVTLEKDSDYTVSYAPGCVDAGNYAVTITLKGNYSGTASKSFAINKAPNPLTVKAKTAKVKYSKVKKKAQSLAVTKVIAFAKKGQGTMSYTKSSGNKKITINKTTGKVTVKKGLKKGKYKVKVKIGAAGTVNYGASAIKTVTFTIRIK